MTKKEWGTIVFALEQYIQECENESGGFAPAWLWDTYSKAVVEMENTK